MSNEQDLMDREAIEGVTNFVQAIYGRASRDAMICCMIGMAIGGITAMAAYVFSEWNDGRKKKLEQIERLKVES